MQKAQNHVEKNVNLSRTRADVSAYETNFTTNVPQAAPFAQTIQQQRPPKSQRPHKQDMMNDPNRTQVSIDPNTDFLIQNLNQNNYKTL